jgi:hypothetical protein
MSVRKEVIEGGFAGVVVVSRCSLPKCPAADGFHSSSLRRTRISSLSARLLPVPSPTVKWPYHTPSRRRNNLNPLLNSWKNSEISCCRHFEPNSMLRLKEKTNRLYLVSSAYGLELARRKRVWKRMVTLWSAWSRGDRQMQENVCPLSLPGVRC